MTSKWTAWIWHVGRRQWEQVAQEKAYNWCRRRSDDVARLRRTPRHHKAITDGALPTARPDEDD